MAEKAAKDKEVRVRKEEALCARKAREAEEQRRFNRPEAVQARRVRENLIALQGRTERMVPTPFKVANEIRRARNLVSAGEAGGGEGWERSAHRGGCHRLCSMLTHARACV